MVYIKLSVAFVFAAAAIAPVVALPFNAGVNTNDAAMVARDYEILETRAPIRGGTAMRVLHGATTVATKHAEHASAHVYQSFQG